MKENIARGSANGAPLRLHNSNSFQRTTIAKICEEGKFEPLYNDFVNLTNSVN